MQLILISGLSGSGKSVALRVLEDSGYYCVDNLPPTMLADAIALYHEHGHSQIAISVDTRSAPTLAALPNAIKADLRALDIDVRLLYLEASTDIAGKALFRDTAPPPAVQRPPDGRRMHPSGARDARTCRRAWRTVSTPATSPPMHYGAM